MRDPVIAGCEICGAHRPEDYRAGQRIYPGEWIRVPDSCTTWRTLAICSKECYEVWKAGELLKCYGELEPPPPAFDIMNAMVELARQIRRNAGRPQEIVLHPETALELKRELAIRAAVGPSSYGCVGPGTGYEHLEFMGLPVREDPTVGDVRRPRKSKNHGR